MRKILFIIVGGLITLSVSAQTLANVSTMMNKICPLSFDFCSLERTTFSNNTFTLYYSYAKDYVNFDSLNAKPTISQEIGKLYIAETYKKDMGMYLINRMINKKVNLRMSAIENVSGKKWSVLLSPAQIKDAVGKYTNLTLGQLTVRQQVLVTNICCPKQIDEYSTLLQLELSDKSLEYKILIDDSFLNIDDVYDDLKAKIKDSFKIQLGIGQTFASLLTGLFNSNMTLAYTYIGKNSQKQKTVVFNTEELKNLFAK